MHLWNRSARQLGRFRDARLHSGGYHEEARQETVVRQGTDHYPVSALLNQYRAHLIVRPPVADLTVLGGRSGRQSGRLGLLSLSSPTLRVPLPVVINAGSQEGPMRTKKQPAQGTAGQASLFDFSDAVGGVGS